MVKGSVDTVAIFFKQRRVAEQRRLWTREDVSFDPRHYQALLERKPGALDHARPLENWDLPKCFGVLRRRLEGQLAGMGTREYIGVLRLLEKHPLGALTRAVTKGLRCGGLTRDAIGSPVVSVGQGRGGLSTMPPQQRKIHRDPRS